MGHPSSKLKDFCSAHKISCAKLATLAGVGRSTAHNLLTGRISDSMRKQAEKRLVDTLPDFLDQSGLSPAQIDQILTDVFIQGAQNPMSNQKLALNPSEIKWFGLPKDPFRDDPADLSEVFVSTPMRGLIDRVIDAIHYQGFISITAPIGSGKTILKKLIQTRIEESEKVHIIWPESYEMKKVTAMQIAEAIFKYFNPNGRVPRGAVNRTAVVKSLLQKQYRAGGRVMIGIDEGHRLQDETLSSLKNFLEMSSGGFQRYLGVVLLGQKSFEGRLDEEQFQELLERITLLDLPPFTPHAKEYLDHRMKLIGVNTETLFDREAIEYICSNAETPLQLGNIANEALRLSKKVWQNKTVIGSAIKTKMNFANQPQQARQRNGRTAA